MDIDQPTGPSLKRSTLSPTSSTGSTSSEKRAKFILPPSQLTMLNNNMAHHSNEQFWKYRARMAGDDDSLWRPIVSVVLMYLTDELAKTDMQGRVIVSPGPGPAGAIVAGFSKDDLEQWKAGVRNGMENGDWSDVIEHRAYDYWVVGSCLIVTTAKLKNPNVPPTLPRHKRLLNSETHRE